MLNTYAEILVTQTIADAQQLGVHIKMLTGDAVAIGKELARQLRLGTNIYDSEKLIGGAEMTGSNIRDFVEAADGFAEVYPEHKYQVVEMLQERGHLGSYFWLPLSVTRV